MRYRMDTDPFIERQPTIEFLDVMNAPVHETQPSIWNQREKKENEVYISGACLRAEFPDAAGLLETAYEDFALFMQIAGIEAGNFCFHTLLDASMPQEAYRITVSAKACLIESADTEGIRRALYYIEDEMNRREGSFLPLGEIYRYAVVKTRITRGFLNPHYEPGCEGELSDDTEYYSDAYLNRLAHEGINGIWVQEWFRAILPSNIIPEYGKNPDTKARRERLSRLITRARRYGIRVYLESIEPASSFNNPALKKHPELLGQPFGNEFAFCSSTEKGRAYIKESTKRLFTYFPDLAGLVNISAGEAVGCCAAAEEDFTCPTCKAMGFSRAQVLANCERDLLEGMRAAKPEAQLISWAYAIRGWDVADYEEYLRIRDAGVISMINFEDLGESYQLGKPRTAMDYWLAYAGPGKVFKKAAETGAKRQAPVFAKLQVCSSHEVSSVPYVPVPGILYEKYRYMHEHGVTGALYCWYFGNYPGLMNKAAGELAFAPFFSEKKQFLEHLAGIYWGSDASKAAEAYRHFEEGYSQYPVSMTFEWHGPMTDAPVWPLHLEPVDLPVSRAYKLFNMVGCDRLGETMLMGHTYEEVLTLCSSMSEKWAIGTKELCALASNNEYSKREQQCVAEALTILFASGTNILRFYDLRNSLGFLRGNATEILDEMEKIVHLEMENSRKLAALCREDKRLGYHAEAVGFKFFPEKLFWRIDCLKELLETEFPLVKKRIAEGKLPLPFYFGEAEDNRRYFAKSPGEAAWESFCFTEGDTDENTSICIEETEDAFTLCLFVKDKGDVLIQPEFEMFHPYAPLLLSPQKEPAFYRTSGYGLFGERIKEELSRFYITEEKKEQGTLWRVTFKKQDFFPKGVCPFRLAVTKKGERESVWERGDRFFSRLIFGRFSPDAYVFVLPLAK